VVQGEEINRERWGELEEEEGSCCAESNAVMEGFSLVGLRQRTEEEEEEEEEEGKEGEADGALEGDVEAKGLDATGLETPLVDGISSVASGLTTPGVVDLRKGIRYVRTKSLRYVTTYCDAILT
jgi:hypothetical protein